MDTNPKTANEHQLTVFVAATIGVDIAAFAASFEDVGVEAVILDLTQVESRNMKSKNTDIPIIFFYTSAEIAIEKSISEGEDPATTERLWRNQATRLIVLKHELRERATILFGTAPDVNLGTIAAAATGELSRRLSEAAGRRSDASMQSELGDNPLARAIAQQWVAASPELADLAGEIEAMSHPMGHDGVLQSPTPARLYEDYCNLVGESGNESASDLEEENELLLLQIGQLKEELSTYYVKAQDLTDSLEQQESEYQRKLAGLVDEQAAIWRSKLDGAATKHLEETKALLERLHRAQEEHERDFVEGRKLARTARDLKQRLEKTTGQLKQSQSLLNSVELDCAKRVNDLGEYAKALERMVTHFLHSTSWRITSPVRFLGRQAKRILRGQRVSRSRLPKRPVVMEQFSASPKSRGAAR